MEPGTRNQEPSRFLGLTSTGYAVKAGTSSGKAAAGSSFCRKVTRASGTGSVDPTNIPDDAPSGQLGTLSAAKPSTHQPFVTQPLAQIAHLPDVIGLVPDEEGYAGAQSVYLDREL